MKCLNFFLARKELDFTDYLVDFEFFCRKSRNLGFLSSEDLDFVKTKTKEKSSTNLSKEVLGALTSLIKNKDIVIQKSENDNSVIIVDNKTFIKRIGNLLIIKSNTRSFLKSKSNLKFITVQYTLPWRSYLLASTEKQLIE